MVCDRLAAVPLVIGDDGERGSPREQDPLLHDAVAESRVEGPPFLEVQGANDTPFPPPIVSHSFPVRIISGILLVVGSIGDAIMNHLPTFGQPRERNYGPNNLQPASSPSPAQWRVLKIKACVAAVWLFCFLVYAFNNLVADVLEESRYHSGDFSFLASSLFPGTFASALFFLWRAYTSRDFVLAQNIANISIWGLGLTLLMLIIALYT